jgi:exodeoxyribonuclease-3
MSGPVRIATFNVNSIKARLDFLLIWLRERSPDVVCLQELKLDDEHFPHAELRDAGYHAYLCAQKSWNGVAVLSKKEGELLQRGLPGQEEMGARLVAVKVDGLTCISVYVPNGKTIEHDDYPRKLAWMDQLREHVSASYALDEPLVIGGDYNITHRDADSHAPDKLNGHIHHTAAERSSLDALLDLGLSDLYRHKYPDGTMFSWWDYRGGSFHRNLGLRIDLLLGSAPLREALDDVWTDRDFRKKKEGLTASDHAPVIADLRD